MYKFAICDDNAEFCQQFSTELDNIMSNKRTAYSLNCFYNKEAFLKALNSDEEFDLTFQTLFLVMKMELKLLKRFAKSMVGLILYLFQDMRNMPLKATMLNLCTICLNRETGASWKQRSSDFWQKTVQKNSALKPQAVLFFLIWKILCALKYSVTILLFI